MLCVKIADCVANNVDPDKMQHSMGLHCLLRPVCWNTYMYMYTKYSKGTFRVNGLLVR